FGGATAVALGFARPPACIDLQVAALDPPVLLHPLHERFQTNLSLRVLRREVHEHADPSHPLRLLCEGRRGQRPSARRASQCAGQRQQRRSSRRIIPPCHRRPLRQSLAANPAMPQAGAETLGPLILYFFCSTSSTTRLIACTPVRMVGSGTGANSGE